MSTGLYELPPTFTLDGQTAYFTISTPAYGRHHVIMQSRLHDGAWTQATVASFSGSYADADPMISPDGKKLFFISRRPTTAGGRPRRDFDIWVVEEAGADWSEPRHVAEASGPDAEHYVSPVSDGSLYIAAVRPDSRGQGDIYRVPLKDGRYGEPENVGSNVNSPDHHDSTPFVAADESYMIFASFGRSDGRGAGDLYVSFRNGPGWTPAVNMGPAINTLRTEYCPVVSHDGRYLYFASERGFADSIPTQRLSRDELIGRFTSVGNGLGDVYRIELAPLLRALRP
jgi:Tol biopolymer transport system component